MKFTTVFSLLAAAALPLLLLSCDFSSNTPTQVNTKINLNNGQALYGVWEKVDHEINLDGGSPTYSWDLIFSDTAAYFAYGEGDADSLFATADGGGVVTFQKSAWSVDSNTVTFQTNPYLLLNLSKVWPYLQYAPLEPLDSTLPFHTTGGFQYVATAFSNLDTLSWINGLYRMNMPTVADTSTKTIYYILKAPYEFTVLNIQTTSGGLQQLHITDRACYDKNKNAASIDSVCEVSIFTKSVRPYFADMLKNVDTLSSTNIWKQEKGLSLTDSIIEIQRGQEAGTQL